MSTEKALQADVRDLAREDYLYRDHLYRGKALDEVTREGLPPANTMASLHPEVITKMVRKMSVLTLDEFVGQFRSAMFPEEESAARVDIDVAKKKPPVSEPVPALKKRPNRRVKPPYNPASPFPQMIDAKEVAAALGCSLQHVYTAAADGRLPHHRYSGRIQFSVDEIRDYIRDHKTA